LASEAFADSMCSSLTALVAIVASALKVVAAVARTICNTFEVQSNSIAPHFAMAATMVPSENTQRQNRSRDQICSCGT
jgi:hypothetical protein